MLETCTNLGLDALELDLRNSFMGKMVMNQARTVVEQTIRLELDPTSTMSQCTVGI